MSRFFVLWVVALMCLAGAAAAQHHAYPELEVKLTDTGVELADTVEAGFYTLAFENTTALDYGPDIAQLKEGVTVEQALAAVNALLASFMGQGDPGAATQGVLDVMTVRGGESEPAAVMELVPGDYLVFAIGANDEGKSFNEMGLYGTFTVTEPTAAASAPTPDLTVDMLEFGFTIPDEVAAGEQTWEVQNVGAQPHHLILMKIQDGKTMEDVMAFMQSREGAPPADEVAYTAVLSPNVRNFLALDLEPGAYVALCFISDTETGAPHVALGMIDAFTVVAGH